MLCRVTRPLGNMVSDLFWMSIGVWFLILLSVVSLIWEPDSYCGSGPAGSDRVPGFVDYLGKGKRKVDDMFPVSCHASDTTTDPVSAPLAGGHAIDDAFCPSSCPTGAGTSNNQCALSHMNAVCTDASISSVMPTVMPAVHDVLHLGQDGCSAVPMPTPPAYESEWRVPVSPANTTSVSAANTTSVHVDMGAVGPGVSAPPAAVASPPARRPRACVTPSTATRRATTDSSIPGRNVGGAPTTYASLGRCNRVCRHCNALFWFEERLKQGGVRFPEYHHC